jgi:4-hydroxy-2-oxoglutarate aldolase
VITPFTNQKVDLENLKKNIRKTNDSLVKGYMPLGSNGEFAHMNDEEQISVVKTIKENMAKDKTLMVGVARHSVYNTVEFAKRVIDIGAEFISVLCPSYFAPFMDDAALIKFYTSVADQLPVPILMYNCPKYAGGVAISTEVVKKISNHPNIAGMKDTSKGNIENFLSVKGDNFDILAGSINNFIIGLKSGAAGGVLSLSNYMPDPCCKIQELFNAGKVKEAEELSEKLISANQGSNKYGVAGVKASCDLFGFYGGEVRSPLSDCTPEQREVIRKGFVDAGYLKA